MRKLSGVYQRGNVWWIDWRDPSGRRHRERVGYSQAEAIRLRAQRLSGKTTPPKTMTLEEFVNQHWRPEASIALKPSTIRGYETSLAHHLIPYFGKHPLSRITKAEVKRFIAEKLKGKRFAYSQDDPNPNRPNLSPKTIKNAVGLLVSIMETASSDYGLLEANPVRGMLRGRHFPTTSDDRPNVLEPQAFVGAVQKLRSPVKEAVLFAVLSGLRWGEQVALRVDQDIDLRRNRLHVSRSLYRRDQQIPKTRRSVRDVDLCPTVRRILQSVPRNEGLVFSKDGLTPIGDGSWVKRQWRQAQVDAGIKRPIRWHDLRHQYVSLLIAAGKHSKYISVQAGHSSAGFTLDRYGHLLESVKTTPVEWIDDLLGGPDALLGCDQTVSKAPKIRHKKTEERKSEEPLETLVNKGLQG